MQREKGIRLSRCAVLVTSMVVVAIAASVLMRFYVADPDRKKGMQVYSELLEFRRAAHYYISMDRLPPSTLEQLLAEYTGPGLNFARSGQDPWGNPFFYEVRILKTRYVDTSFQLTIRSRGPNGRDDSGAGDDIQFSFEDIVTHTSSATSSLRH